VIQRVEDIDKGQENAPDYDDSVFPNIPNEFWDNIEARKIETSKISAKNRGRKGKRKISVQSCSLYWNFVSVTICCAELLYQLWICNVPKPNYCCRA